MNDAQFIAEVKNLAELDSDEDARKAIGATLETLRERLAGEEPSDLAANSRRRSPLTWRATEDESPSPWRSSTSEWRRRKASVTTRQPVTPGRWRRWCKRL